MTDNRNTILAVILSGLVLIGWQYFYNVPQMEKQRAQQAQSELAKQPAPQAGSPATPRDHAAGRHAASAPMRPRRASRHRRRWWSAARSPSPPRRASRSKPRGSPAASR